MELKTRYIYPSGISVGSINYIQTVKASKDKQIEKLYLSYISNPTLIEDIDFKLEVYLTALKTIRHFHNFFNVNLYKNKYVHGNVLEYLCDTLDFIGTGKRKFHSSIWANTLSDIQLVETMNKERPVKLSYEKIINENKVNDLLNKWVSYPNGTEDLLFFLYLMFSH